MSVAAFFEAVGYVLSTLTIASFGLYFVHRFFTGPRLVIQLGGTVNPGHEVHVPVSGEVAFAISSKSRWLVHLEGVRLLFDPREVEISAAGGNPAASVAERYPICLDFGGPRTVARDRWQGFRWVQRSNAPAFDIALEVTAHVDEAALPFVFDWFPIKSRRSSRTFRLVASPGAHAGEWSVPPKSALLVEGPLAQAAVYGRAESGTAKISTYEIVKSPPAADDPPTG